MSELNVDTIAGSTGTTVTVKTGHTLTLVANMNAATAKITNLGDPSSAQDAATKNYVDTQLLTLDTLGELTNVTITSVADNEVLAYDNGTSLWINQTASEAGLATSGDLSTHTSSSSNPHSVTASQVGATTTANKIHDFAAPTSALAMNAQKITGVADPTAAQDASTKAYVDSQVQSKDALSELSGNTDDVSEGSSNLYYTNERVDDRFNDLFSAGTGITGTYDDGNNTYTINIDSTVATLTGTQVLTNKSIDSDNNTITNIVDADIKAAAAIDATKIADGSVTSAEFQHISTLSSNAQTQLDAKATTSNTLDEFANPAAEVDINDQDLSKAVLKDYAEKDVAVTSGTTLAIDLSNGNTGSVTLAHSVTDIDFTNVPADGTSTFTLKVTQDGTGSRTLAINAITVNGGSTVTGHTSGNAGLTLSTAAASVDLVTFLFFDADTPLINGLLDFKNS